MILGILHWILCILTKNCTISSLNELKYNIYNSKWNPSNYFTCFDQPVNDVCSSSQIRQWKLIKLCPALKKNPKSKPIMWWSHGQLLFLSNLQIKMKEENESSDYLWDVHSPLLYDSVEPGKGKQSLGTENTAWFTNVLGVPGLVGPHQVPLHSRRSLQ